MPQSNTVNRRIVLNARPLLDAKARMPVCGLIAAYNATDFSPGPDRLGPLVGLESAPEAFIGLLEGKNFGELVSRLAHE